MKGKSEIGIDDELWVRRDLEWARRRDEEWGVMMIQGQGGPSYIHKWKNSKMTKKSELG